MKNRRKTNATKNDISLQEALTDLQVTGEQGEQAKGGRTLGSGGVDLLVGNGNDVVYGGGGLDILIANTGGDR
jgi:hypothetical protein